jgi:hypothetical protein
MNYLSIVFISLLALSVNAQELTFSATRRLVEPVLNNEIKPENIVEITYTPEKKIVKKSHLWKINGSSVPTKGWEFVKGYSATSKDKIQLVFTKVGNYSIELEVETDTLTDEETFIGEYSDFITVRSLFPELAALYAQKPKPSYMKLVEKASEYVVKPKYATDPTPNLFLAKGMLGLAKRLETTPKVDAETAMSECISSYVAAKELDLNGVLFDDEHQRFIIELESYLFDDNIKEFSDFDPGTDAYDNFSEYVDYYSEVSSIPFASTILQGYIMLKDGSAPAAIAAWKGEIATMKGFKITGKETTYGYKVKDAENMEAIFSTVDVQILKMGVIKAVDELIKLKGENGLLACELLTVSEPFLVNDREFESFFLKRMKELNCKTGN